VFFSVYNDYKMSKRYLKMIFIFIIGRTNGVKFIS